MSNTVGIDSQVFTYLLQANTPGYKPANDHDKKLAQERHAAYMIFCYSYPLKVGPVLRDEITAIKNEALRNDHLGLYDVLFSKINIKPNCRIKVESRAKELSQYHCGKKRFKDCLMVSEAEWGGVDVLLTFDCELKKNLKGRTGSLQIKTPSEFWTELDIPKGIKPKVTPHPTHPHSKETWWHH